MRWLRTLAVLVAALFSLGSPALTSAQVQCEDVEGNFFIQSLAENRAEDGRPCLPWGTWERLHHPERAAQRARDAARYFGLPDPSQRPAPHR